MNRSVIVVDAPSNLALRPPVAGAVPGVYKLPGVLRDLGLLTRLHAMDGGVVTAPRYSSARIPGAGAPNTDGIVQYARSLASRLEIYEDEFQLVLGGDCSILFGVFSHLAESGAFGLMWIDAHSSFGKAGHMQECDAIAGEELAILSGIGDPRLTRLASRAPMLDLADVVLVGVRDSDPSLRDVASRGARLLTSSELDVLSPERAARRAVDLLTTDHLDGFWVQFDVDVIDASEMPAVDTPEHGGPTLDYMAAFLRTALSSRKVIGMSVTLYDPDRDVDGRCGRRLADLLVNAVSASA